MPNLPSRFSVINTLATEHGAKNVRVFGSYATGQDTPESDLDLLVDLEPGRDLLDLIGFKQAVEEILGVRTDVLTEVALSPHLRQRIIAEARPL